MPSLEKQRLNLKIYIRLLLYVKDKYEKKQNSSQISSSLIEYLKEQIHINKESNDELTYDQNDAFDYTFTNLFTTHENTKTRMSKIVEKLLTSIKKIRVKEKQRSYLDSELRKIIGIINKEDLKTLDEVLVERRAYFYDMHEKYNANIDIIETIETIDGIRVVIGREEDY